MDPQQMFLATSIGLGKGDLEPLLNQESLDQFQKGAIYRQLREYKRLYEQSQDKLQALESSLSSNKQVEVAREKYQMLESKWAKAEKALDRIRMLQSAQEELKREVELSKTQSNLSLNGENSQVSATANNNTVAEEAYKKLNQELQQVQFMAQSRQEQIQQLERNRLELIREMEQYTMQPKDADIISQLDQQLREKTTENEILKEKASGLAKEIEQLTGERRTYQQEILQQKEKEIKKFKSEKEKANEEIARLRKQRDAHQEALNLKNSKEQSDLAQQQGLRKLLESQTERIQTLEMEVQRLLMSVASDLKDKVLLDFFHEKGPKNPIQHWKNVAADAEKKVSDLQNALKAFEQASAEVKERQAILQLEDSYSKRITELETKNKELEALVKVEPQELKAKIDFYEKSQSSLMTELTNLGKSWSDLQKQVSKKLDALAQIEELKAKHREDKIKLDNKNALLVREASVLNNSQIALKKQSTKQLEMIVKLQEREKNLNEQLGILEKELAAQVSALQAEKEKVASQMQEMKRTQTAYQQTIPQLEKMSSAYKSKVEQLESEASVNRKLNEQVATLNKKIEILNKDGDVNLNEQLQNYKLLLKCSSCNNRFKSHVLLKCMHVFCKECLDDMYNSRQRKCPSCSLAFGQHDIKQIFL